MAAAAIDHLTPDQTRQLVEAIGDTLSRRYSAISSNPYPLLPQSEVYGYAEWFVGGGQVSDRAEAMALCHALVRLQQWLKAAQVYEGELELPGNRRRDAQMQGTGID